MKFQLMTEQQQAWVHLDNAPAHVRQYVERLERESAMLREIFYGDDYKNGNVMHWLNQSLQHSYLLYLSNTVEFPSANPSEDLHLLTDLQDALWKANLYVQQNPLQ
ncbi:MAG: hypothetical protein AAGJ82_07405 [Bacteroidota bacterium]